MNTMPYAPRAFRRFASMPSPPKPKRPRGRPPRVYGPGEAAPILHSECLALDVVALARAGFLAGPGVRSGRLALVDLSGRPFAAPWVEVEASVGAESGELALADVRPQRIRLARVGTGIGPMWRLSCPCGKAALRRLFRPRGGLAKLRVMEALWGPPPWMCRGCHEIRYARGGRRDAIAEASRGLADALRLHREAGVLVGVARESLAMTRSMAASHGRDADV
jgi:hypothetical protein